MSDEQEDIGLSMTINDELRLCGMVCNFNWTWMLWTCGLDVMNN